MLFEKQCSETTLSENLSISGFCKEMLKNALLALVKAPGTFVPRMTWLEGHANATQMEVVVAVITLDPFHVSPGWLWLGMHLAYS